MSDTRLTTHVRTDDRRLSRRTALRGLGVAVALPWLTAMAPPSRAGLGGLDTPARTRRLIYVYAPNGAQREWWKPAPGALGELPPTLSPLQPHARRLSVVSGLAQHHAKANGDGPGDHARAAAAWLTGVQPLKGDGQIRLGRSADQVVADHLGDTTPVRSLQLGCDRSLLSGQCDSGYACAYQSHISWRSATTPAHKDTSPRRLFDRLFRGGDDRITSAQRARRKSILDFVRADAKRLERDLGGADRDRLDSYLTGLRELEARIERTADLVDAVPDEARPDGPPDSFDERAAQLFALLTLALEHDATRVATFLLANEGSNRAYPDLGSTEGHHGLSHHRDDVPKKEALQRIEQHHTTLFATLLTHLDAARDGAHDLLSTTTVVYGSGIGDGNRHDHDDLPLVVAGDLDGLLPSGQHVTYPERTPMNDLHWSLIERMGARVDGFGDAKGRLGEV